MKVINVNAAGRFQGSVEWFRIETPEDRYNLIGEPGEILLCEATGETWNWDSAAGGWVASAFARSPDGSTLVADKPVVAPSFARSPSTAPAVLKSRDLRLIGFGSSSLAECSRPQRIAMRTAVADRSDTWSGFLRPAVSRGIPFSMEWNGGVVNTTTDQILTSIGVDMAVEGFPEADAAIILPFANDIPSGVDPRTKEEALRVEIAKLVYERGLRVILIMPHTRNPSPVAHTGYLQAEQVLYRLAAQFSSWVYVANHYRQLSPTEADTDLVNLRADGQHLSHAGYDALYPVWEGVARWLGWKPETSVPGVVKGVPLVKVSGAGAVPGGSTAIVSCTIVSAPANEFGTPRWDITGNAAVGSGSVISNTGYMDPNVRMVEGRLYRLYIDDLEVLTAAGGSTSFMPGCMVVGAGATSNRWRCLQWGAAGVTQAIPVGTRIREHYGPIFRCTAAIAASHTLALYPGDAGGKIRASYAAILEVQE